MVLNSDHPATWAWADIYRMRPCHDKRQAGNEFQDIVCPTPSINICRIGPFSFFSIVFFFLFLGRLAWNESISRYMRLLCSKDEASANRSSLGTQGGSFRDWISWGVV